MDVKVQEFLTDMSTEQVLQLGRGGWLIIWASPINCGGGGKRGLLSEGFLCLSFQGGYFRGSLLPEHYSAEIVIIHPVSRAVPFYTSYQISKVLVGEKPWTGKVNKKTIHRSIKLHRCQMRNALKKIPCIFTEILFSKKEVGSTSWFNPVNMCNLDFSIYLPI